ncbi:MAG TPA: DNA primase, partial [Actinobacteria bacterium]|nr:DNA primase [Actinomycetes bacterium]HEX21132.1 DNA primase [Actinomycetota bacterium]
MSGLIREDDLEQIKDRVNIIDIISEQVMLKKAGRAYKGLCPFHQEKTPSFSVDTSKQLWHCFGCGEGGDVISFVMKVDGLDFTEAVESLARRVGYAVHYTKTKSNNLGIKQKIYEINAAAAGYFSKVLFSPMGRETRDYLKSRGFGREIAETMWLGFAPDTWDGLKNYLLKKNFLEAEILKAGLTSQGSNGKSFDRFRGRLIFPIKDIQGRVVAFGARSLNGDNPKYLNSPETPVYRKGSVLYGLNLAKTAISSQSAAIIVEGYTDLLALKMSGIDNAVATCGTAFTLDHFKFISRFTDDIIFVFDGDAAGIAAAERGLELVSQIRLPGDNTLKKLLNSYKIGVKVLVLPEELDPAEYVAKNGVENFRLLITNAKQFTDFYLERIMIKYDINDDNQRQKAIAESLAFIKLLASAVAQEKYLKRIAEMADVSLETL